MSNDQLHKRVLTASYHLNDASSEIGVDALFFLKDGDDRLDVAEVRFDESLVDTNE